MQITFPHLLLSQLSELLEMKMGLYYPEKRWDDLERRIASAAQELGMRDTESGILQLLSSSLTRRQIEILARHLTVGETYFFREQRGLDVLEGRIFPELMRMCKRGNRKLRSGARVAAQARSPTPLLCFLIACSSMTGNGMRQSWLLISTPHSWTKQRRVYTANGLFGLHRTGLRSVTSNEKKMDYSRYCRISEKG